MLEIVCAQKNVIKLKQLISHAKVIDPYDRRSSGLK